MVSGAGRRSPSLLACQVHTPVPIPVEQLIRTPSKMSASNRALSRLPLSIFTDLATSPLLTSRSNANNPAAADSDAAPATGSQSISPEELRNQICKKLKDFHQRPGSRRGGAGSKPNEIITTVGQLLKLSPDALLRAVDPLLTGAECHEFIDRVCAACAPRPQSALSLLQSSGSNSSNAVNPSNIANANTNQIDQQQLFSHLSSGMQPLDDCLRGGFRVGTITEVVGRAGIGKTQLVMQLCVTAAKVGKGSVYIDTERKLSLRRMKEIAQERRASQLGGGNGPAMDAGHGAFSYHTAPERENMHRANIITNNGVGDGRPDTGSGRDSRFDYKDPLEVLENITVHSPRSTQELLSVVSSMEDEILIRNDEASYPAAAAASSPSRKFPVGLIVLDSIAAPARRDFGAESAMARVNAIFQIAQTLKRVADQLNVAVVVINQVSNLDAYGQGEAALGVSWHHCVSTRLVLDHERDPHKVGMGGANDDHVGHVRTASVVKSNVAPHSRMSFEVNVSGVCPV